MGLARAHMKEFCDRRTTQRTTPKRATAKRPERRGEKTHDSTMPVMPPGRYFALSGSGSLYHVTQAGPLEAMAMPTRPPTQEWVVETGISNLVAMRIPNNATLCMAIPANRALNASKRIVVLIF